MRINANLELDSGTAKRDTTKKRRRIPGETHEGIKSNGLGKMKKHGGGPGNQALGKAEKKENFAEENMP